MKFDRVHFLFFAAISLFAFAFGQRTVQAELLLMPSAKTTGVSRRIPPRPGPTIRPTPVPTNQSFRITKSRVDVRINENIATTTIEQSFLNLSGRDLEVRVLIPLPKGASVNKSALSMNDEMVKGKLYDAKEAMRIYTQIVNQRRDPALLRFVGEGLYEARVFPIPPNKERRLKFSYDHVLKPISGLYDFRHILSGSQLYQRGLKNFSFECVIRSKLPLGTVYSPSHIVAIKRTDAHTAVVKLKVQNLSTDRDFKLYFGHSTKDINLRMVTHRSSQDEDGYFMVMARPGDNLLKSRILPKEIVFVLDKSGSMAGDKIKQAKKALTFCISQLNERDRFNLVTFSTNVWALSSGKLLPANELNVKKALRAIDMIEATGGTDIDGALRDALGNDFTAGAAHAKLVIFLTDGLPSVGITDIGEILRDVRSANKNHQARIFNFGVGVDVNTHLLDRMASAFDGSSSYVAPKENLELKMSAFYNKIKNPVMTGARLSYGDDIRAHSIYPRRIPVMFQGSEVLLVGRFKGQGPDTLELSGHVVGEKRKLSLKVNWPSVERNNDFLPRVWAMRKVGHLLEDIRLRGSNKETIAEVVHLAQRYGIVTPYTSQLVLEPGMTPRRGMGRRSGRSRGGFDADDDAAMVDNKDDEKRISMVKEKKNMVRSAREAAKRVQRVKSGNEAVVLAVSEAGLKNAKSLPPPALEEDMRLDWDESAKRPSASIGGKGKKEAGQSSQSSRSAPRKISQAIRHLGDRTFYQRGGTWVDATFKKAEGEKPEQIEVFSEAYFKLLEKHPDLGKVFTLSGKILIMVDGKAIQIVPAKK